MKGWPKYAIVGASLFLAQIIWAQDSRKLSYTGQLSSLAQYSYADRHAYGINGRYLPQLNLEITTSKGLFDLEASANLFGNVERNGGDWFHRGKIRPYRVWMRYSNQHAELRLGLQKINFGSAQLLRPLMWFDSLDPRDPLQITEGVWGGLFRYYFKNNANLWLWILTGNEQRKGWEWTANRKRFSPEAGGRFQLPVPQGEAALTLHYRSSTWIPYGTNAPAAGIDTGEFRVGLDAKIDVGVGLCLESTYQRLVKDAGLLNNQLAINVGADYTFAIGNGIGVNVEHLFSAIGDKRLMKENRTNMTALMLTYPIGLSDMISFIGMYGWEARKGYSFLGWKRDYDKVSINLNAFWNSKSGQQTTYPPIGGTKVTPMEGVGIQFIFQWTHSAEKTWCRKPAL